MAIFQRVFAININHFIDKFKEEIIIASTPDFNILYDLAYKAFHNPSYAMQVYFRYVRVDEEIFDLSDPDISRDEYYFLICLSRFFSTAPDLSSGRPHSYAVLSRVLRKMNWTEEDINLLIRGRNIGGILNLINNKELSSCLRFDQYSVGWLSTEDINKLYLILQPKQNEFFEPNGELLMSVDSLSTNYRDDPRGIIRKSYVDAMAMLEYGINNKKQLVIGFD